LLPTTSFKNPRKPKMATAAIKKTRFCALALTCLVLSATTSEAQAVMTRGAPSCGKWIAEKGNGPMRGGYEWWLLGFLTGVAVSSDKDFLRGTDNESIYLWVDNYCSSKPLSSVTEAGDRLSEELIKQKKL
jgi:hypothetical protein